MTPDEARAHMLAALAAAGVNGMSLVDEFRRWSVGEGDAIWDALQALADGGIAQQIGPGMWRLSDQEFARRILRAVGVEGQERIDAVVGILRGL